MSLRFCPDYSIGVTYWLSWVQRRLYVGTEQAGVCFGAGNAEAAAPIPLELRQLIRRAAKDNPL